MTGILPKSLRELFHFIKKVLFLGASGRGGGCFDHSYLVFGGKS